MTDKTDSKEREAFEAFVRKRWGGSDRGELRRQEKPYIGYVNGSVDFAWAAFQAGRASLAASAGSEPVAQPSDADAILSKICDLFHIGKLARTESTILTNIRNVIHFTGLLRAVERDLFPQPELPEDDDPYAEVDEGLPAPNSWAAKDEVDYVAQFRAALAARGFTHPPPPEGAGWRPIASFSEDEADELLAWKPGVGRIIVTWLPYEHPDADEGEGWHEAWSHKRVRGITHGMLPPAPPASEAKGA